MTCLNHDFAPWVLTEARNVMRRPDLHGREDIIAACGTAQRLGDWTDHDRAEKLLFALRIEVADELDRAERDIVLRRNVAWGGIIVGLAVWASLIWFGPTLVAQVIRWGGSMVGGL